MQLLQPFLRLRNEGNCIRHIPSTGTWRAKTMKRITGPPSAKRIGFEAATMATIAIITNAANVEGFLSSGKMQGS